MGKKIIIWLLPSCIVAMQHVMSFVAFYYLDILIILLWIIHVIVMPIIIPFLLFCKDDYINVKNMAIAISSIVFANFLFFLPSMIELLMGYELDDISIYIFILIVTIVEVSISAFIALYRGKK